MQHEKIKDSFRELYQTIERNKPHFSYDCSAGAIRVTSDSNLDAEFYVKLSEHINLLKPWRIGPYQLLNIFLDAEWDSDMKWQRLEKAIPDLQGKIAADVGCNNGYFLFRLLNHNPEKIIGFDPFQFFRYQFDFLRLFISDPRIEFRLSGIEDLRKLPESFDFFLCLGVIAHRKEPLESLKNLYTALKPGGSAIIENIIIDVPELFTDIHGRYAQMHNIHTLTNQDGFLQWLERAGFKDPEILSLSRTDSTEQRQTPFMDFKSLNEFLDPNDRSKTIEGYPAPHRLMLKVKK